jgi:4-amino-4-deoxychorismate lyase
VRNFALHMARLAESCRRLRFPPPDIELLETECRHALGEQSSGVVKLVLTRGPGPRGYRPPDEPNVTRVITASAARPAQTAPEALTVRLCDTRLGQNPALAGMKHLNRLEQVMACKEWSDPAVGEGLMLSMDGRLVSGTAANLFVVRDGRLETPAIRDCGVAGVMRQVVLHAAHDLGIASAERDMGLEVLTTATEVFLTNAVAGIRPGSRAGRARRMAARSADLAADRADWPPRGRREAALDTGRAADRERRPVRRLWGLSALARDTAGAATDRAVRDPARPAARGHGGRARESAAGSTGRGGSSPMRE